MLVRLIIDLTARGAVICFKRFKHLAGKKLTPKRKQTVTRSAVTGRYVVQSQVADSSTCKHVVGTGSAAFNFYANNTNARNAAVGRFESRVEPSSARRARRAT